MNKKALAWIAAVISTIWMLNPTGGWIEIPDALPIIGNLDEATMMALLLWAISVIRGKEITFGKNESDPVAKAKPAQKADGE